MIIESLEDRATRIAEELADFDSKIQCFTFDKEGKYSVIEFARRLTVAPPAAREGMVMVPREPTAEMWGELARDIIFWHDLDNSKRTPRSLFDFLERLGRDIPDWLRQEQELQNLDHAISKGTRAVIIYKAMLAAALRNEGKP